MVGEQGLGQSEDGVGTVIFVPGRIGRPFFGGVDNLDDCGRRVSFIFEACRGTQPERKLGAGLGRDRSPCVGQPVASELDVGGKAAAGYWPSVWEEAPDGNLEGRIRPQRVGLLYGPLPEGPFAHQYRAAMVAETGGQKFRARGRAAGSEERDGQRGKWCVAPGLDPGGQARDRSSGTSGGRYEKSLFEK